MKVAKFSELAIIRIVIETKESPSVLAFVINVTHADFINVLYSSVIHIHTEVLDAGASFDGIGLNLVVRASALIKVEYFFKLPQLCHGRCVDQLNFWPSIG